MGWFCVHPLLMELCKRMENGNNVDLLTEFLLQNGTTYTRVSELIHVVLIHLSNCPLIELCIFFSKAAKTPKHNALKLRQLERLILLGRNLPEKLSEGHIDSFTDTTFGGSSS